MPCTLCEEPAAASILQTVQSQLTSGSSECEYFLRNMGGYRRRRWTSSLLSQLETQVETFDKNCTDSLFESNLTILKKPETYLSRPNNTRSQRVSDCCSLQIRTSCTLLEQLTKLTIIDKLKYQSNLND